MLTGTPNVDVLCSQNEDLVQQVPRGDRRVT